MEQSPQIQDAEKHIVKMTIRHYFNAKDECVPGLPYGWECTLCKAVKAYERILGSNALEETAKGKNES